MARVDSSIGSKVLSGREIGPVEVIGGNAGLNHNSPGEPGLICGPYRARTDDIHGVNVALYQLS